MRTSSMCPHCVLYSEWGQKISEQHTVYILHPTFREAIYYFFFVSGSHFYYFYFTCCKSLLLLPHKSLLSLFRLSKSFRRKLSKCFIFVFRDTLQESIISNVFEINRRVLTNLIQSSSTNTPTFVNQAIVALRL